jgi:phospholipid transport system substrate-binding protein
MSSKRSMTVALLRSSARWALAALLLALAPFGAADEVASAKAAFQQTVDDTLSILNDKSLSHDGRVKKLEGIADDRFDFPKMAQLVLGKNRAQLSPEQQAQFLEEFKQHLSLTYGRTFDRYTGGEKIAIGNARLEANKDVTIGMNISGGSAPPDGVRIDYRLRQNGDRWLVLDVIPEGVSLIQNFRSQVQEIVTQKGVGNLIQTLHEKNAQRAQSPSAS